MPRPCRAIELMSGPEIQANIIDVGAARLPAAQPLVARWGFVLVVLLALIVPLAALRLRGWRAPRSVSYAASCSSSRRQSAFDHGRVVPVVYPLLALVLVLDRRARRRDASGRHPRRGAA